MWELFWEFAAEPGQEAAWGTVEEEPSKIGVRLLDLGKISLSVAKNLEDCERLQEKGTTSKSTLVISA